MALFLVDLATFLIKVYTNDSPKLSALHLFISCLALRPPAPLRQAPAALSRPWEGSVSALV